MQLSWIAALLACALQWSACSANILGKAWNRAVRQTLYEQEVEDVNSVHKIDNHLVRRLIVMPLTEAFKPNQADLMFDKVQYGDKCSLPTSIGRLIFEKRYEVPWLFELKPVSKKDRSEFAPLQPPEGLEAADMQGLEQAPVRRLLEKAYISPLDFRSPENYIFLPKWLMKDLGLAPNEQVDVSFVRIKLAEFVVFQPLTLEWDELMETVPDPKALLEHEINKYSSLTAGSTIYIEIKGVEYPLYVKQTMAEGGVAVKGVRVQDSDIRTDIDRSFLDELLELKKKKKKQEKLEG
ncbi:ubiquitin fusion degradation protein UFD1-domain-containing protein [Ochromonadaceae sp. CCMP2298]|nr:ubiquitin fusion degradation protein UFD1-domain-containing protein [Ochromonadaceae sp. CCMP2298]|mmetsp:Transcript_19227/g.42839  ORF Transcript_19227/g.42839 Transcript_19227/m.42839 type:complete len:294 (+) Transcript_19227:47-928(+)